MNLDKSNSTENFIGSGQLSDVWLQKIINFSLFPLGQLFVGKMNNKLVKSKKQPTLYWMMLIGFWYCIIF